MCMEDINDNTRNLYIIKRRLAERKREGSYGPYWTYYVGNFIVEITPFNNKNIYDSVVQYECLNVSLFEETKPKLSPMDKLVTNYKKNIYLLNDPRFINYEPLKKSEGLNGIGMPLVTLCELIKYLHRLSNLNVFS